MSIDRILLRYNLDRMTSALESRDVPEITAGMGIPRSSMVVNLDHHFSSKVYTSSSPVCGTVTITTRRDVPFDAVQIHLIGRSRTRVDGVNATRVVSHVFLKLSMPISEPRLDDGVLLVGETYTLPFEFVIPDFLTLNACDHHVRSPGLHDQHVLLPPTMGTDAWDRDDMTPRMAEVEYLVSARVLRLDDAHGNATKVLETDHPIRVLPASVEEPPLELTKHDKLYTTTKTKTLRRGFLAGKLGRVTAEAVQPAAVVVRPEAPRAVSSTTAMVRLWFDPAAPDILPPKVTGVTGKITAHTFFSGTAISDFPNHGNWARDPATERRGHYHTSASLPTLVRPGEAVRWSQRLSPAVVRRDSGYSSDSTSEPRDDDNCNSESEPLRSSISSSRPKKTRTRTRGAEIDGSSSPILHTATLRLPVRLPQGKKTFIPTFHSCITSRVYTLQLSISLSAGPVSTTINLSVPVQVAVQPEQLQPAMGLPSFEAAVEEYEADEHLRPRVVGVPDRRYTGTSVLPGYGR